MAQKTLAEQFHATRDTELNPEYWNKFVGELSARFASLESIKISWEVVVQQGLQVAIDRINEVLGPAAQRIQNIAALGFLSVPSTTSRTLALGINNFVLTPGDQRDLFVPTPFVAVTREAQPLDYAIGQVTFFDRASGSMDINVVYIEGDGAAHSDWTISAVAGQALAQATILGATNDAAALAVSSRNAASTSATSAAASAGSADSARAAAVSERDDVRSRIADSGPTTPATAFLGRLWFDGQLMRVYDGTGWAPVLSSALGGLRFVEGAFPAGTTGAITVDGGFTKALLFVNGSILSEDKGDFTTASPVITYPGAVAGEEYLVWAYKALDATDYFTKEDVNATFAEKGAQAGDVKFTARRTPPAGWLKANGAALLRASYPELDSAIYVGDSLNGTALYGYRCSNPASPSASRATTGAYIVLPDLRGEFLRSWDDGRGLDSGRAIGTEQESTNRSHTHGVNDTGHTHGYDRLTNAVGSGGAGSDGAKLNQAYQTGMAFTGISIQNSGGSEARPHNVAMLAVIKY